ncbi:transcriptional repressor [Patescibacteria group bacterium]|jgi:Fe2+ or Zn2+ uptake regulation protein|nr:transcriptional repressor [Patescibacteria group bacterium]
MAKTRTLSLKEELRAAGFRATPGRLALAQLLMDAHGPLGTPTMAEKLVPGIFDLATLYRTLKSFEEAKLVRMVPIDQRFASYEWIEDEHGHHHHLVCQFCGLIEEIPPCDLETLEKKVLAGAPRFASVTSHSLEFFGTCLKCRKRSK